MHMQIQILTERPEPHLAAALLSFESNFQYPLGPDLTFRISHGDDYGRFFRAMGEGASIVASDDGAILGTIGVALRELKRADGTRELSVYIGDLKVLPTARSSGRVAYALIHAAQQWARGKGAISGFGVVMEGTASSPEHYTGRLDIPMASKVSTLQILRIPTSGCTNLRTIAIRPRAFRKAFSILSQGRCVALGGKPSMRSAHEPAYLLSPESTACGILEDTMRAKRLFASNGEEIASAHLSRFAFCAKRPDDALQLLREARGLAADWGFPALFVAIDEEQAQTLQPGLRELNPETARAFVYGLCLGKEPSWIINTTEI